MANTKNCKCEAFTGENRSVEDDGHFQQPMRTAEKYARNGALENQRISFQCGCDSLRELKVVEHIQVKIPR